MKRFLFILSLFFSLSAFSQSTNWQIEKLEKQYRELAFQKVILNGTMILKKRGDLSKKEQENIYKKIANACYYTKDYGLAETYFAKLYSQVKDFTKDTDLSIKYAEVLAGIGKHNESAEIWAKLSETRTDSRAKNFAYLQANPEPLTRNSESYDVEFLPINSVFSDFSPSYFRDGLVFVSGRPKNSPIKRVFAWDDSPFLDLYFLDDKAQLKQSNVGSLSSSSDKAAKKRLGKDFYTPATANDAATLGFNSTSSYLEKPNLGSSPLSKGLNSIYHEGPADFFNNDKSIIFTRNGVNGLTYESLDGINRVHLFMADNVGLEWKNLRAFPYNSGEFSTGHPAFMTSENILFFISDMPGGEGGTDIYFSKFENGRWYKPQNAGSLINTKGNEMFPFIDEANVLYFASNGHPGLGGLDLFSVQLSSNGFVDGAVHNFGAPINSSSDDFGLLTDANFTSGYFSSNRKAGGTDDNIYSFKRRGDIYACKDIILNVNSIENQTLSNTNISYYEIENPHILTPVKLDNSGKAKLCLASNKEFFFVIDSPGLKKEQQFFSTKNISNFTPSEVNIYLKNGPKSNPTKTEYSITPEILVMNREKDNRSPLLYSGRIKEKQGSAGIEGVKLKFVNKNTKETQLFITNATGNYSFYRNPKHDYEFTATKSGYATNYEFVSKSDFGTNQIFASTERPNFSQPVVSNAITASPAKTNPSYFDPKVFKVKDKVSLNNIYYEAKDLEFSNSAKSELKELLLALRNNPEMVIEVRSHTDSRGSSRDNLKLSQNRADQIKKYLVQNNISTFRIKATGVGELYPVNQCKDGVKCTEAEYRRNRRTEFNILQVGKI